MAPDDPSFILTGGQEADVKQAMPLIDRLQPEAVIGDKGYESHEIVTGIESRGAQAVIRPKRNRNDQRQYDKHLDKERNLIERFFNLIKHYRRVATRYEKTARNFLAFVHASAIMVLLH